MHKAVLSERERALLAKFLNGEPINDETFRMLKLRVKRNYPCISQDFQLIKETMDKMESVT